MWTLLVYAQIGNETQQSRWVQEAYDLKESAAEEIDSQKVVIVAGSNALFGFDSEQLENHWNIPVINGGIHAGLGMPYILERSKRMLKSGDIVLLPLEYRFYQADGKPSETLTDFILSRDRNYFYDLPILPKFQVISRISIKRLINGIRLFFNKTLKPTKGLYGIQNINHWGDQIKLDPDKMTERELAVRDQISPEEISGPELSPDFIRTMDAYIRWADEMEICLIILPPTSLYFEVYRQPPYSCFLSEIQRYYSEQNVKFAGAPYDYMYDVDFYYNTRYHLNSQGIAIRTDQVIRDLGETPECNQGDPINNNSYTSRDDS